MDNLILDVLTVNNVYCPALSRAGSHKFKCCLTDTKGITNNMCLRTYLCWFNPAWKTSMVDLSSSAGCPMSEWSVWSECSCVSQRQQRYRVALSPATRGQQCTPVETQTRSCSISQCDGESVYVWMLTSMNKEACL